MSKTDYVQLEAVKNAIEKYIDAEETVQKILDLLSVNALKVEETQEPDAPDTEDNESETDDAPKKKNQFVILVSDPARVVNKDLMGWVLQIPEDEDVAKVIDGIKKGAYNFNASKKGRKYPVTSIGQAVGEMPSKFLKPYYIKVKTKEPVQVVVTDNVLPKS